MLINFHLSSKESRAQSNLFSNSISSALNSRFFGGHQQSRYTVISRHRRGGPNFLRLLGSIVYWNNW